MNTEKLYDSLTDIRLLINRVKAQDNLVMNTCRNSDCGYTVANKECDQHSRCVNCPQRYKVSV